MNPSFIKQIPLLGFIFNLFYFVIIIFFSVSGLYNLSPEFGALAAKAAVLLLTVSLIPGIIIRFSFVSKLSFIYLPLKTGRRYIGIAAYLSALAHGLWSYLLPSSFALPIFIEPLLGLISLIFLTPLVITSNDFSQQTLKNNWNILHKTIHVLIIIVLIHVVLMEPGTTSVFLGCFVILNLLSFVYPKISRH